VLGVQAAGLEQYPACRIPNSAAAPTGHELTGVIAGLAVENLPDRWHGYVAYDALVWTGSGLGADPASLKESQADAIREWVRRGGHLIVVMPSVGQSWYGVNGPTGPLADILPDTRAVANEGVELEPYRALMTSDNAVVLPKNAVVHTFETPGGRTPAPFDAMPLMVGVGGDTVVVRRLSGTGAVTGVGIDLTTRALRAPGALQAQQFWNRVLGKRMKVLTPESLDKLTKATPSQYAFERTPIDFDRPIADVISKQSKAAKGLLVAFAVFVAYWLLAGPAGYLLLKKRKQVHHAWVAFSAVTAVFALVGWGASSTLKLGRDLDKHYTLIDHVYGQTNARMRSWVELTLPKYGEQRVSVKSPESTFNWHNLLTAWESGSENSTRSSFPDARPYVVDTRSPDTAEFPARATTRQLQIDFAGAVPSNWDMIRPLAAEGVPLGQEIYIEDSSLAAGTGPSRDGRWKIQGKLTHNLPGPLHDVFIFVVREVNLRDLRGDATPAQLPALVYSAAISDAWGPGQTIDLDEKIDKNMARTASFFANIRGKASTLMGVGTSGLPASDMPHSRMAHAQAFFSMLEPPDPSASSEVWATRASTHGWDLGRWFTQPCVIVVGLLGGDTVRDAVECPVPISIDSASAEDVRKNIRGLNVVRWIYPLKASPPRPEPRMPNPETALPGPEKKPG